MLLSINRISSSRIWVNGPFFECIIGLYLRGAQLLQGVIFLALNGVSMMQGVNILVHVASTNSFLHS